MASSTGLCYAPGMLLFIAALLAGLFAGYRLALLRTANYKARWKEALAALETALGEAQRTSSRSDARASGIEQRNAALVFEPRNGGSQAGPQVIKDLLKKSDYTRQVLEEARLKAGLPPIDPLTGLSEYDYTKMVKLRFRAGYDESGQKVQEKD